MNINEEIKKVANDMEKSNRKLNELAEKYQELIDKKMESSDSFMKGVCPVCNGNGWIQREDDKQICPGCNGRQWTWFQLWIEKEEEE
jgi:rubrerythrin